MEKEEMKRGVWGVTTQVVVRRLYIIYGCNTGQQGLHVVQSSSSIYARGGRPIFCSHHLSLGRKANISL